MKKMNILLLLVTLSQIGYSQELYMYDRIESIKIYSDYFVLHNVTKNKTETVKIERGIINGLEFFFTQNGNILVLKSPDLIFLYNEKSNEPFFWGANPTKMLRTEGIYQLPTTSISSSSFLKSGDIKYGVENITDVKLDSPWTEGSQGYGIDEKILVKTDCRYIYISNGFVSIRNPNLYLEKSRVKKLRIVNLDNSSEIFNITLYDTPNPQKIDLLMRKKRSLGISIIDVYKGTKYEETCINFILCEVN